MTAFLIYMASPAILYILVTLFTNKSITRNTQAKKMYLLFAGICMTFMIGLRAPTNGSRDTLYYFRLWEYFSGLSFDAFLDYSNRLDLEHGYMYVTWVLSQIFANGQWVLFFSGMFMSISVCSFIYKNCRNPIMALVVFNCLGLFNFMVQGLRQAIAMCICLWALELCKQRKLVKFLLLVALACSFHASALVFIPVYFLCFKKFTQKNVFLFSLALVISIICLPTLMNLMNLVINDSYTVGKGSDSGGIVAILIYVVILVFALIFRSHHEENFPLFICMAIVGLTCMILRRTTNGIIERINFYYAFSQMVLVSNSIPILSRNALQTPRRAIKESNNIMIISLLIFTLCFGVAVYKASYSVLIPYLFCWQY